jgi:hypothetical protein
MTLFHPTQQTLTRPLKAARRRARAPTWMTKIAWTRLAALALNIALWGLIILAVRAFLARF